MGKARVEGLPMRAVKRALRYFLGCMVVALAVAISTTSAPGLAYAASTPTITAKNANTGKVTMKTGSTYNLGISATKGSKVTYKSSKPKVVKSLGKGKIKALKAGKATITVTAKIGKTTTKKKVTVTVVSKKKYKAVKSIKPKPTRNSLVIGETTTIKTKFTPSKASNKNLRYKSSNTKVLTVSANGKVTAVSPGTAKVTVTSVANTKAKKTIKFTVKEVAVKSISATATQTKLKTGTTASITAVVSPSNATNKAINFTSSNTKVLTVSADGKVTAVSPGTAKVTVTSVANSKVQSAVTFTVYAVTYTVKFETGKGSAVPAQIVQEYKRASAPPDPTYAGFAFDGWYTDEGYTQPFDFSSVITKNTTVYAKWRKVSAGYFSLSANKSTVTTGLDDSYYPDTDLLVFATTDLQVDSLDVYDADTNEYMGTLSDSGDYDGEWSFDDIAGDGIYSGKIDTSDEYQGNRRLVARYGNYKSDTIEVSFYKPISNGLLNRMDTVDSSIESLENTEAYENGSTEQRRLQANKVLDDLETQGLVVEGFREYDEKSQVISFEYGDGVLGGISLKDFDDSSFNGEPSEDPVYIVDQSDGSDGPAAADGIELIEEDEEDPIIIHEQSDASTGIELVADVEDEQARGEASDNPSGTSTQRDSSHGMPLYANANDNGVDGTLGSVLVLNSFPAFETKQEKIDYRTGFYHDTRNEWQNKDFAVELKDGDVTVDDYRRLNNFDVAIFATHGSTYTWKTQSYPAVCLAQKAIWDTDKQYSAELQSKQLVRVGGCYWILPSFFESQYGTQQLSNTFIFAECCEFLGHNGSYDYSMTNALLSRGAKGVVGFHNSVYADYSREFMKTYVDYLMDSKTSKQAFDNAKSLWGNNHKEWHEKKHGVGSYDQSDPVAVPVLVGQENARLIETGIANGDFEAAVLSGSTMLVKSWTKVGDVRSVTMLGDVRPASSKSSRMAIITTGIGSSNTAILSGGTEGSVLYQSFVVPAGAKRLSFDYNMLSEEPMEFVGSEYNDAFHVQLIHNGSEVCNRLLESINTSKWTPVGNVNFPGGDDTAYQTGWKSASIDVSSCAGKLVTLKFVVYDVGDSLYDSAAVIDNVMIG